MVKHHVTRKEAQAVVDFACFVAAQLGLPKWAITVLDEPADDDAMASIEPLGWRWVAELKLNQDWMTYDSAARRNTIVHEVCHLLHYGINHVIEDAADLMHDHEWQQINRRYHRATEYMVDHLAGFIDSHYDLRAEWDRLHER